MAFTLLSPWIRRLEDFYRFTQFLSSWTLLPSYAKMPSLLPYPHPMACGTSGRIARSTVEVRLTLSKFKAEGPELRTVTWAPV